MKKLLTILFFIPFLCFSQIGKDKYYHASAGAIIAAGTYSIGYYSKRDMNPIAPTLVAFTAGFGKEMYDSFHTGNFSGKDLLWTTASALVINVGMRLIWKKEHKKLKREIDFEPELPLTKR